MFEPITTFLFLISMAVFLILVLLQEWRIHKFHKESIESAAELAEARFEALHAKEAVLAMLNDAAIELCVTDGEDIEDGGGKVAQHDVRQEPGESEEPPKARMMKGMEPDIAALQYPYLAVRKANGRYALLHPIVGTVEKSDTTLHAELFDWLMAEHKGFDLHRFCTEIPQWQARAMAKRPLIDIEKSMAREDISPTERQYLEEALAYHKRAYADFKKEVLDPDAPARPRVYVSGPVSGHDLAERIETFQKAAKALMRNSDLRPSAVVNPVDLTRDWIEDGPDGQPMPTRSYADFMRKDILALLSCDAIAMLPGWEKSVGASAELAVALSLGMKAWQLDENFSSSELPLDNRWLVR